MSETANHAGQPTGGGAEIDEQTRRDFLIWSTAAVGAIGTAIAVWPFIDQMNPAADTLALASTEVDISQVDVGQSITVIWRGKPVFIRHRTPEEIEAAQAVGLDELPDPQKDADRVVKPEWLVMVGVCTHLGCIPLGQKHALAGQARVPVGAAARLRHPGRLLGWRVQAGPVADSVEHHLAKGGIVSGCAAPDCQRT